MSASGTLKLEWADFDREPFNGECRGPTADDIRAILRTLCECEPGSGFVILSRTPEIYIQAVAPREEGEPLIVEYRDGSEDRHFAIDAELFDAGPLTALFEAFVMGTDALARAARWEPIDI
ncbi:MAG: hypothetical protein ACT4PL_03715 [Phycisphaerales bacterium]